MKLENRVKRLIAVGASITANCQPCLQTNVTKALENGADEQEIAEAIEIGKMVRQGAASKMDQFAISMNTASSSTEKTTGGGCECSSQDASIGGKNG